MSLLIINTLPPNDSQVIKAIKEITAKQENFKIIHTFEKDIKFCCGCYHCWLKTPGICSIKDAHEEILTAYIQYENIVYIANISFGFIDSKTKKIIDRILPLQTFVTQYKDGETRKCQRYIKNYKFGILYRGNANEPYLNYWLERFSSHIGGSSIGAFVIDKAKEMNLCIQ